MTRLVVLASAAVGAVLLSGTMAAAAPFDWAGFYAGVHSGQWAGHVNVDDEGTIATGHFGGAVNGVLGGYRFRQSPASQFVFGFEGDLGVGDFIGHGTTDGSIDFFTYDFDWDAHLRATAGLPLGNVMPFVAGGLALAQVHVSEATRLGGLFVGGTLGGGIDFKLAPRVIARGETLVDAFMDKSYPDYHVSLWAWTTRVALIVTFP
jgi:outer membrane immunogenic protein